MSRQFFGTDGIRGKVGQAPITPEFVLRLGHAAGEVLVSHARRSGALKAGQRPAVLIGKDTRISGYMIEAALEAGFAAAGVDVVFVSLRQCRIDTRTPQGMFIPGFEDCLPDGVFVRQVPGGTLEQVVLRICQE